jgi:hypothetical protein
MILQPSTVLKLCIGAGQDWTVKTASYPVNIIDHTYVISQIRLLDNLAILMFKHLPFVFTIWEDA